MTTFVIEELTGSQRRIVLRGRALPERGVGFGTRLRHKATWYAGNQVGTLQVFGPEVQATDLEGIWNDRYVSDLVDTSGFGALNTAGDLVGAFESLCASGNALRVQWGPQVRNGILAEFTPEYEREQDVRWTASFAWYGRDDQAQPRATPDDPPNSAELLTRQNEADDELAFAPPDIRTDYLDDVRAHARSIRGRVGSVFDRVRSAQRAASVPLSDVRALLADAEGVRRAGNRATADLVERTVDRMTDSDDVLSKVTLGGWTRSQGRAFGRLRAQAQRVARQLRRSVSPEPFAVVSVREGETLRTLARRFYGTSDDWQRIAAVNSLPDSVVPIGTIVVVPPKSIAVDTTKV